MKYSDIEDAFLFEICYFRLHIDNHSLLDNYTSKAYI
jgi:hypothetical protein